MKRSSLILITVIAVIVLGMFGITIFALMSGVPGGGNFGGGVRIAVIPVEGVIGGGTAKAVIQHLNQFG